MIDEQTRQFYDQFRPHKDQRKAHVDEDATAQALG
jgi:hypothetical protein